MVPRAVANQSLGIGPEVIDLGDEWTHPASGQRVRFR